MIRPIPDSKNMRGPDHAIQRAAREFSMRARGAVFQSVSIAASRTGVPVVPSRVVLMRESSKS